MERARPAPVAGFFSTAPVAVGALALDAEAANHVRVRRLAVGDALRVTDGLGRSGVARLAALGKRDARLEVEVVHELPPPPDIHLLAPVGDRDRMLWMAEKAVELGLRSWRPVLWRRSRSVTPRGEGEAFRAKVRARMIAALEQSGGAWLPALHEEAPPERALSALPKGARLLLDAAGAPLDAGADAGTTSLALGPEGGLEPDERDALQGAAFRLASLGPRVLRFETAALAALAILNVPRGAAARPSSAP